MAVAWYKQLWRVKLTIIVILTPIICLPVPILAGGMAGKCAYAILIMAIYWMTEVIPMAVTALLPVVLMPWLGIMDTKDICENYLKDANMLFFGGLMVAVAVEKWNLHKRIALRVLMLVGSKPRWLMFGFMATTAFLSMWISNTATTAMMVPISHAVLTELDNHRRKVKAEKLKANNNNGTLKPVFYKEEPVNSNNVGVEFPHGGTQIMTTRFYGNESVTIEHGKDDQTDNYLGDKNLTLPRSYLHDQQTGADLTLNAFDTGLVSPSKPAHSDSNEKIEHVHDAEEEWFETVGKGMRLSIAYAANIGGTATLTGTGPNLVLKGQLDTIYGPYSGINFSTWFVFAFPNMLISLFLAWIWLMFLFLGPGEIYNFFRRRKPTDEEDDSASDVIHTEYAKLGKMSFAEGAVLIHFIVLALMWLTRDPEFVPGWGSLLPKKYVTDSCVAITISVLLFIVPSRCPNYLCFRRKKDEDEEPGPAPALLDWPTVHKNIPWNVMLLLGGGFALADACKRSGLSEIIGEFFVTFGHLPVWVLALVLSTLTAVFTEVTSNVATATIFLPILAELASKLNIHPLYLMLPVTVSASFAFMLPVATPPNAIVFAYGNMKIWDMMKAGFLMNCVCLLVLQLALNTWTTTYFGLNEFPDWAVSGFAQNSTAAPFLNISSADM